MRANLGDGILSDQRLWYERVFARVGLSLWTGGIVFGPLLYLGLLALGFLFTGLWSGFLVYLPNAVVLAVSLLGLVVSPRYICNQLEELRTYARSMVDADVKIDVDAMYDSRSALLICLPIGLLVLGTLQGPGPALPPWAQVAPFVLFIFFFGTFFWVWVNAMVAIYRMGKLPLGLRPFTEDRTLGLKPFARSSLRLTGIYLAMLFILSLPELLRGFPGLPSAFLLVTFYLFGIALFLSPLVPLHRKLLVVKREKTQWIGAEYSKTMESFETTDSDFDDRVVGRLLAIDKIQRDIQQIRTWPFETSLLIRLTAIIVSVIAILLARFLTTVLRI